MAIREELILDLSQALSTLDDLERSLDSLIQPIEIPVKIGDDAGLERLARDADRAEDEFEDLRQEVDRTDDELEKVERQAKKTGDDLQKAGKKGEKSFKGMTKGILAFGAALGGIAALRAVGGFFADSISAASDLEESVGKATVVFGEFFGDIEKFTETAPQALGLSTAAALEMTGTFGNLFVALGLSQQAAADLAPDIVQLGADLASFNNLEVTDALDKLRAGLVGEAEPLRALGVNLTAATTTAKAMELGLVDVNGVVTEAGKVQARYALILEQTATSQGDFARTADGLANRQRTLTGLWENAQAAIGEALVPAFEALLELAPDLIGAIETGLVPALESFSAAVASIDTAALASGLSQLPAIIGGEIGIFSSFTQGVWNLGQALMALTLLNFEDFGFQLGQAFEDFDDIESKGIATKAITNLIVTLGKGTKPAKAFEAVLKDLGENVSKLDLEQFETLADQLVAIADLEDIDIVSQIDLIKQFGPAAGFSEAGVAILVQALLEARSAAGILPPPLDEVARGTERAGRAAADAAPGFFEIAEGTAAFAESLRRSEINAAISELESQFDTLPGVLGAAASAIKTEGKKVTKSLDAFAADFREALEDLEAFEFNLLILRALGMDNLADIFEAAGPEAAQAAADAVLDQAAAQEFSDIIAGRIKVVGPDMINSFAQSIISEPVTDALIDAVIEGARDANTPAARQAAIDLANILTVTIPIVFGDFPDLTVAEAIVVSEGIDIEPGLRGFPDIVQIFESTPDSNTETERAAQAIAAVIAAGGE